MRRLWIIYNYDSLCNFSVVSGKYSDGNKTESKFP